MVLAERTRQFDERATILLRIEHDETNWRTTGNSGCIYTLLIPQTLGDDAFGDPAGWEVTGYDCGYPGDRYCAD